MSKLSHVVTFAAGALVGSAAVWQHFKKQYEEKAQQDYESLKEAFSGKTQITSCETNEEVAGNVEESINKELYEKEAQRYSSEPEVNNHGEIRIISPEEFGSNSAGLFTVYSLTYYADGVLADDTGEIIDIESTIGHEALLAFGEYADNAVYVRNEQIEADIEVLRDPEPYSEVFKV